jgi:hypothetical protein
LRTENGPSQRGSMRMSDARKAPLLPHILFFKHIQVCSPLLSCFDFFFSSLGVSKGSRHTTAASGGLALLPCTARPYHSSRRMNASPDWFELPSIQLHPELGGIGEALVLSLAFVRCTMSHDALAFGGCARGIPAGCAALLPFLASACGRALLVSPTSIGNSVYVLGVVGRKCACSIAGNAATWLPLTSKRGASLSDFLPLPLILSPSPVYRLLVTR